MPIEDAHVEVYKDGALVAEGYTDATGRYTTSLDAGTYLVRISKTGYATIEKTETLARSTELVVNLPDLPPVGVVGASAFHAVQASAPVLETAAATLASRYLTAALENPTVTYA